MKCDMAQTSTEVKGNGISHSRIRRYGEVSRRAEWPSDLCVRISSFRSHVAWCGAIWMLSALGQPDGALAAAKLGDDPVQMSPSGQIR